MTVTELAGRYGPSIAGSTAAMRTTEESSFAAGLMPTTAGDHTQFLQMISRIRPYY